MRLRIKMNSIGRGESNRVGLSIQKILNWIKKHQLLAFWGITFTITWGLGFTYGAVFLRDQFLWMPLASVATCAPGLAGILVTSITGDDRKSGSKPTPWLAFLFAWVLVTAVFVANNMLVNKAPFSPIMLGAPPHTR